MILVIMIVIAFANAIYLIDQFDETLLREGPEKSYESVISDTMG